MISTIHATVLIFLSILPLIFYHMNKQNKKIKTVTNEEWAKSKVIKILPCSKETRGNLD